MRILATFAVLALSFAASPALAQGRAPMRAAVLVGFEDGDGPAGLSLRFDGELVQRPLAPNVGFSIVGSLGFSRFTDDASYVDPFSGYGDSWEASLNIFKFVPAARLTFGGNPRIRPYVDAGLGVYYASFNVSESVTTSYPYPPYYITYSQDFDDSEFSFLLRLAAGLTFDVSPGFALGAEVGMTPYMGDYPDDTLLSLMFAAQFRL